MAPKPNTKTNKPQPNLAIPSNSSRIIINESTPPVAMPRKAIPASQRKQILSVSLTLPMIDSITEVTNNRSKWVSEAIQAKLDHRDSPSINHLIRLLSAQLESITDIQQTHYINPAELDRLHQNLTDLFYISNPAVE